MVDGNIILKKKHNFYYYQLAITKRTLLYLDFLWNVSGENYSRQNILGSKNDSQVLFEVQYHLPEMADSMFSIGQPIQELANIEDLC